MLFEMMKIALSTLWLVGLVFVRRFAQSAASSTHLHDRFLVSKSEKAKLISIIREYQIQDEISNISFDSFFGS